jgi:thiamine-phosphate pyrophosphorylase
VKLHVLVEDYETAKTAVDAGATVVQLRTKGASTDELVDRGRDLATLPATFVVNDDVEVAIRLGADGVHLGREDEGAERALEHRLLLGLSAMDIGQAIAAERAGASYIGAGPIWSTPSKPGYGPALGLDGLAAACAAVPDLPVLALAGVGPGRAADCIAAGARGVAVMGEVMRAPDPAAIVRTLLTELADRAGREERG